jgi:hypothetical protein
MKPKVCPDCGSFRNHSMTGLAQDLRCLDCDAPLFGQPSFYKYLGGLIVIVLLVLAGAWIVLGGQASPQQPF